MSFFEGLKFRKVSSPIHDLDPRIKFVFVLVIFVLAVVFAEILPLLFLFILQLPFVLLARVGKQWLRSLKGAIFFAVLIFLMNFIVSFIYAGYVVTAQMVENAFAMTFRFVVLVSSFSIFFLTTSPDVLGLAL